MSPERPRVLAIVIDAAEPTLVRRLIDDGEMPYLAGLLGRGTWSRVKAFGEVGSGAVWPTFVTGVEPAEHGIATAWGWNPSKMTLLNAYSACTKAPFWKPLVDRGASVGALDIHSAWALGVSRGFEVAEWGAHERVSGTCSASPDDAREIVQEVGPHPFAETYREFTRARRPDELHELASVAFAGAELRGRLAERLISRIRPELAMVSFSEVHRLAHSMWHTAEPDHPMFAKGSFDSWPPVTPGLIDLHREVDRQIGRLLELVPEDAAVMVFSLHGMQPGAGYPMMVEPLLSHLGFAELAAWSGRSWTDRGRALFAALKGRIPDPVKERYYRMVPGKVIHRMAQPTLLGQYDWSSTRAFSLPTDQHGYIRLNLQGREAQGTVRPEDYESTLRDLEEALRGVVTADGRPLVQQVFRLSGDGGKVNPHLPDLVFHFTEAAFDDPFRLAGGAVEAYPLRPDLTGRHAFEGFCVATGELAGEDLGETVLATDLGKLLVGALAPSEAGVGRR